MRATGQPARPCLIRDVGLGGLYVEMGEPFRPGDECTVAIGPDPLSGVPSFEAQGRVVHAVPGRGVGVEFTRMSVETFDRLDRMVLVMGRSQRSSHV